MSNDDVKQNAAKAWGIDLEKAYSPKEVKDILRVSYHTVLRMIDQKRIEAVKVGVSENGKEWRISGTAILAYLSRNSNLASGASS